MLHTIAYLSDSIIFKSCKNVIKLDLICNFFAFVSCTQKSQKSKVKTHLRTNTTFVLVKKLLSEYEMNRHSLLVFSNRNPFKEPHSQISNAPL